MKIETEIPMKIRKARTQLILFHEFFGALVMNLDLIPCKTGTFRTDAKHLWFNLDYMNILTDKEVLAVFAEEVLHCAFRHMFHRRSRHKDIWNIACDCAIMSILRDSGFEPPQDSAFPEKFSLPEGESADWYYNELIKHAQKYPDYDFEEHNIGSTCDPDKGEDRRQLERDWEIKTLQAAEQAKARDKLPGGLAGVISGLTTPKLDWRELLRSFVERCARNDYDWTWPSRRYIQSGLYLPAMRSDELPEIVIAIDTSSSISDDELRQFGSEVRGILTAWRTTAQVVFCDAAVNRVDELDDADFAWKPGGRGGTSFRPPFEWAEKQGHEPACMIYLTDLMGDHIDRPPEYPVMWIVTEQQYADKYAPPFGEVIVLG